MARATTLRSLQPRTKMKALITFPVGRRAVKAHRHPNGGGWVADTAHVEKSAYIGANAVVFNAARVLSHARIVGNAMVYGEAVVRDNAYISEQARVCEQAVVGGSSHMEGWSRAYGTCEISGRTFMRGHATVMGTVHLRGEPRLDGGVYRGIFRELDGFTFTAVPCMDGLKRIVAGCRYFTYDQAVAHWGQHSNLQKRRESMAIVNYFRALGQL